MTSQWAIQEFPVVANKIQKKLWKLGLCGRLLLINRGLLLLQTPATTRTSSFSENRLSNDFTPAKKSRGGLPAGSPSTFPMFQLSFCFVFVFFFTCIHSFASLLSPFFFVPPHLGAPLLLPCSLLSFLSPRPSSSSLSSSSLLLHKLFAPPHLFRCSLSLRLSPFYTVASEECS